MPPKITQVSWSASNLPLGINFDKSTGKFSGTLDEAGEYDVPVKVETNYGSDEKYVHISVAEKVHWEKISLGNVVLEGYQPILYAPRNGYLIVPGETQYYKRTTIPDKDRPDLGWSACGHTNHDMDIFGNEIIQSG